MQKKYIPGMLLTCTEWLPITLNRGHLQDWCMLADMDLQCNYPSVTWLAVQLS